MTRQTNIPGVFGIGLKTALKLLRQYGEDVHLQLLTSWFVGGLLCTSSRGGGYNEQPRTRFQG